MLFDYNHCNIKAYNIVLWNLRMMLNYKTVMVSDACSAFTPQEHAASLDSFLLNFGDVQTTEEVMTLLRASQH